MPRIAERQANRSNASASTPKDHFRTNIYLPFLHIVVQQMNERFSTHAKVISQFSMLLLKNYDETELPNACYKMYQPLLYFSFSAVEAEVLRWRFYWKRLSQSNCSLPNTIADVIVAASKLGTY